MELSMIEQIISEHSKDRVVPGGIVWMDIDLKTARDFGGANVVGHMEEQYPNEPVADPERTFFTFDTVVPAKTIPYAENQHIIRRFARKWGLKVYDVDAGIGSHIVIEEGLATPGATMAGTDSHLNILGAVGAFGQGMGDMDIAFIFRTGKTWFEVPRTMRVAVEGRMPRNCSAKDLTLAVVGTLGSKGGLGMSMEMTGDQVESLSLSGRITLASMATEMGAVCALIEPNGEILEHFRSVNGEQPQNVPVHVPDYLFEREVSLDVSDLEALVSMPGKPDKVRPVSSLGTIEVDSVFIGSCTNGSYEDISEVARIVEGTRIHPRVMAKVVPATRSVWKRLLYEGKVKTLFDSGFIISNSGCGGCASGQIGMTGPGEVQVSTSNRNFMGKQGKGDTYLASPRTAAASALLGRIASIDDLGVGQ
ncbi:MAG: aconitase/3-isopropylmalate dehydratase large subunit family protein [Candidatus Thermoplasmatota archaeon]|nr:aconitase/3-isopropylmalate dehydratase large subunit family protein [Candidatus Thermoplasmatota archaeon]